MYIVELAFGHCSNGEPLPKYRIEAEEYRGLSAFIQFFRGGQLNRCTGGYLSSQGQLVIEPCTLIKAYTANVEQYWIQLMTLASDIATALDQESVLLVKLCLDGMLYWAKPVGKLHQITQMQLVGLQ